MARFRTRARTVDLLGRQQIAGIPTAIHELFKNAHDAYADHVHVDAFRHDGMLVLRDDGIGMSRLDFETRWLVVGTESKVRHKAGKMPYRPPGAEQRPVLGEKGIGRLAIGILGPALLVLTRSVRGDAASPLVAAFLHWEVFSLPGIDLEQIEVPVEEMASGQRVDRALVRRLVDQFQACIEKIRTIEPRVRKAIQADLDAFDFDPWEEEALLPGPDSLRLQNGGSGTQFWVRPVDPVLWSDLELADAVPALAKLLQGFANSMTPGAHEPVIDVAFRDHQAATKHRDVLDRRLFFEPGEMENADHYISGMVDASGTFQGTVSVFGDPKESIVTAARVPRCGPFEVQLAYVQGNRKESTLPDEDWRIFTEKADLFGGVYVYMDGIRVLPYGAPDFDWLRIEEKRTRGAGHYFFSHRRMCGVVLLERALNTGLKEKAGREGFIRNAAYRDLQGVLTGLLEQWAADYFRKEGSFADRFFRIKEENTERARAAEARSKQTRKRRKEFEEQLRGAAEWLESEEARVEPQQLARTLQSELDGVLELRPSERKARVLELTVSGPRRLALLAGRVQVSKPRIGLTKQLTRDWQYHQRLTQEYTDRYLSPVRREFEKQLHDVIQLTDLDLSPTERLREALAPHILAGERGLRDSRSGLKQAQARIEDRITAWREEAFESAWLELRSLSAQVNASAVSSGSVQDSLQRMEGAIRDLTSPFQEASQRVIDQLEAVTPVSDTDPLVQLAAMEQTQLDLKDQLDDELQAAQLGMAIAVIGHEFGHFVKNLRDSIRALGPWSAANSDLALLIDDIRVSFEHLDGYLTLFTPLQRRLYRKRQPIVGRQLEDYLNRLFGARLEEDGTSLECSERFRSIEFSGFPSTYYPILVNLVDNALHWLRRRSGGVVTLDADDYGIIVIDNGPGVPMEDRDWIFGAGNSTKPGGRGLGLTISRDLLRKEKGDLVLLKTQSGAHFKLVFPDGATLGAE